MRERISESSPAFVNQALEELAAASSVNRLDTLALGTVLLLQWTPVFPGIAATYNFHPRLIIRTRSMDRFQDACKRALVANRLPRPAAVAAPVPERREARAAYRVVQAIDKPPRRKPAQRQKESPEERRAAYLAEKSAM